MAKKNITTIVCFIVALTANSVLGTIHYVPEEYANIQDAILACQDFDTIVIASGRYTGPGNRNISFRGKAITVRSTDPTDSQIVNETIIDCEGQGRGFVFYLGEKANSTLSGLTITNGDGFLGGAIYCYNNSSPSIINCVIKTNSAVFGGGLACTNSNTQPTISNCNITANTALVCGGSFYFNASSPVIKNCIISGNVALDGGAFFSHNIGNPIITNCTISQNTASRSAGGAIYCCESSNIAVTNSILWGNTAAYESQIKVGNSGAATSIQISYCNIQGGKDNIISDDNCTVEWGEGNIDADPNFVNLRSLTASEVFTTGDYHLLCESPCIDAGNPDFVAEPSETDIDGNPRILGERIDLGADEVTLSIAAEVKITPQSLSLVSNGNRIGCAIVLHDDNYDIGDVNIDSITLSTEINPTEKIGPVWNNINERKLHVKFDRYDIQQLLTGLEGSVLMTVTGKFIDGVEFTGSDTIKVLQKGK
jgi:hypothetical protein